MHDRHSDASADPGESWHRTKSEKEEEDGRREFAAKKESRERKAKNNLSNDRLIQFHT